MINKNYRNDEFLRVHSVKDKDEKYDTTAGHRAMDKVDGLEKLLVTVIVVVFKVGSFLFILAIISFIIQIATDGYWFASPPVKVKNTPVKVKSTPVKVKNTPVINHDKPVKVKNTPVINHDKPVKVRGATYVPSMVKDYGTHTQIRRIEAQRIKDMKNGLKHKGDIQCYELF